MSKPTRASMKRRADKLFSEIVRSRGYCEASDYPGVRCGGPRQCAHVVGRRFHSVRWSSLNALCLCAGHHVWFTNNPEAWRAFLDENWPGRFDEVWRAAQEPWDHDIESVLDRLKAKA